MIWPVKKIGEITEVVTKGTTPSSIGLSTADAGIPFLRVQNVNGTIDYTDDCLHIPVAVHDALSRSKIYPGDVLVSIAGTIGRTAVVPANAPEMNCNQAIAILRPLSMVHPQYLAYWLESNEAKEQISGVKVTATISNLSLGQIKLLQIPLPPLAEQKRIAAILDKADAIRKKRKQAIELTQQFLRSAFLEMFGDPVTNPKGWEVVKLGSVLESIDGGWSANGDARPRESHERAVLKISAVTSGRFDPDECKVVAEEVITRKVLTPLRGDLLFSRANTRELVAATCLVEEDAPMVFLPDKLWKLVPVVTMVRSEYLRYLLSHPEFRQLLTKQATGTSGSMLNVSKAKLQAFSIPLPSIDLQQHFSALVWKSMRLQRSYTSVNKQTEELFACITASAFSGRI